MSLSRCLPRLGPHISRETSTASTIRFSSSSSASSQDNNKPDVFRLENSTIFKFGTPSNEVSKALFTNLSWRVAHSDAWAILSPSSSSRTKENLISTILSQTRFVPSTSGTHPILSYLPLRPRAPEEGAKEGRLPTVEDVIQLVSFKTRLGSTGGGFQDYTARYYSIREEDKLTVREHLERSMPYFGEAVTVGKIDHVWEAAKSLEMEEFLELPMVTLSNGQTRRIRIVKAILARPELIILEEPFTGLDTSSRTLLVTLLSKLQSTQSPRVLLVLRPQDPLPEFISHLALVAPDHSIQFGTTSEILNTSSARQLLEEGTKERERGEERRRKRLEGKQGKEGGEEGKKLVELKGVNVTYSDRKVLIDINWTIREGERWVLAGHNGSGKSTLLSLILGDHPRSFMEDITLFGKPRVFQATSTIRENIGHISPEIYNAFPRKFGAAGLTVEEAIMSGFDTIYCYRKPTPDQKERLDAFLAEFNHPLYSPSYLALDFASLPPGEQSLALFLRACIKRPDLLILDESFSFMPKGMVDFVKNYLDNGLNKKQAVIFISHFEEEIPSSITRTLVLEHGKIIEKK